MVGILGLLVAAADELVLFEDGGRLLHGHVSLSPPATPGTLSVDRH